MNLPQKLRRPYRLLYESALFLHTLDKFRAERKPRQLHPAADENDQLDRLRLIQKFLDYSSYICDWEIGGKTVSAAAFQHSDELDLPILVLASNQTKVSQSSLEALQAIFQIMAEHAKDHRAHGARKDDILSILCGPKVGMARLRKYREKASKNIHEILGNEDRMKLLSKHPWYFRIAFTRQY